MERWILIVMKYYHFYDKIEKKIIFQGGKLTLQL